MRTLLRWMAASVALVAGLVLGAGTANASSSPDSAAHTAVVHQSTVGGMHPNDWWWD